MNPDSPRDPIHPRQRARAKVMAIVLAACAVLFFAITIVKLRAAHNANPVSTARAPGLGA